MKNKHAIRFGIFAGIGTVLFLYLFYWMDKKMMLQPSIVWSTMFLYIIAMYMAPLEERKENEGYLLFKPALKASFLVYIIANGIYTIFNYILYNFLDPGMLEVQKEYFHEHKEILEGFLPQSTYEEFVKSLEHLNYSLGTIISHYFITLIGGFILAVIIANIIKRNPPVFEEEDAV